MRLLTNKSRLLLSALIFISFFIPAYNNVSAFRFITMALSEPKTHADVNLIDVLIVSTPLVLIPLIAIVVFVRAFMKVPIPTTITGLPLLLLIFFFVILSFSGKSSAVHIPVFKILFQMQVGFYLAAVASLLLLFTKNASRRRRKRKVVSAVKETAVVNHGDV